MKIRLIGWLLEKGYVTPAVARGIEAFVIGLAASAIVAALTSVTDMLSSGASSAIDYNAVLTAAVTAAGLYVRKALRDAATEAAEAAKKAAEEAAQAAK